ncbi:hypothetical protein L2E82_14853 [Cichorium intybus]|uniref:Uncharacterized protein n=1 Tax=Cichorium intybus TaxID=13427 RepID=A0ACB9F1J8_CICIN|nr:hypothetical protein L2E82_14853 [Cichorium intybus]
MSSGRTIEVIPEEGDDILGLSVAFFVSGGEGKVDDHWCLYLGDIAGCLVSGLNGGDKGVMVLLMLVTVAKVVSVVDGDTDGCEVPMVLREKEWYSNIKMLQTLKGWSNEAVRYGIIEFMWELSAWAPNIDNVDNDQNDGEEYSDEESREGENIDAGESLHEEEEVDIGFVSSHQPVINNMKEGFIVTEQNDSHDASHLPVRGQSSCLEEVTSASSASVPPGFGGMMFHSPLRLRSGSTNGSQSAPVLETTVEKKKNNTIKKKLADLCGHHGGSVLES